MVWDWIGDDDGSSIDVVGVQSAVRGGVICRMRMPLLQFPPFDPIDESFDYRLLDILPMFVNVPTARNGTKRRLESILNP